MVKVLAVAVLGLLLAACSADEPTAPATPGELTQSFSKRDVEEAYCGYYARCVPLADYLHCVAAAQQLSDDAAGVDQGDASSCVQWAQTAACDAPVGCPLF